MASPSIPPLRYQKGANGPSPNRPRPLSELSPMALRRNSPSFPQPKANSFIKDSSPAVSSPFSDNKGSPHLFWQTRDQSPSRENRNPNESQHVSPSKRSSIENLKKASRVKNSNMFMKEQQHHYDPARPKILDGRPLSMHLLDSNSSNRMSLDSHSTSQIQSPSASSAAEMQNSDANSSMIGTTHVLPLSPSKKIVSPAKSSLSKKTGANMRYSGFDPDSGIWEDDDDANARQLPEGRILRRHAKSVTFDQAPPQVNEYEMTTPDPSSVASGSREGSYESVDDDEDEGEDESDLRYERGSSIDHEDSFDASLEDTDKTPVVLPEDWRFMSPESANTDLSQHDDDIFDHAGSPPPNAHPGQADRRPHQTSVNSVDSNGQPRPLPPLPSANEKEPRSHSSRGSLSGTIERISSGQRALPSPLQATTISKHDLRRMSNGSLSLEDRLRLMMVKDPSPQMTESDAQRERRMRRAATKDVDGQLQPSQPEVKDFADATAPHLDRNAILKQLRDGENTEAGNETENVAQPLTSLDYDPDVPIPSREDPTLQHALDSIDDIAIKVEDADEVLLDSIPDMYASLSDAGTTTDDEETSQYSQPSQATQSTEVYADTPRAQTPVSRPVNSDTVGPTTRMSLPDFVDFGQDSSFNVGLESYLTPPTEAENKRILLEEKPLPSPPRDDIPVMPDLQALRQSMQRPFTPEEQLEPPKLSFSGDESSAEPGTPNSVIRHPIRVTPEVEDAVEVAHEDAVSEQFSFEASKQGTPSEDVSTPPRDGIPMSQEAEASQQPSEGKRVSSLVQLELPPSSTDFELGFGLEQEFDRVVEAQKRGYLMRQNTKVVVASERAAQDEPRDDGVDANHTSNVAPPNEVQPSPRKTSQPTWTAEPWNGKSRRRSIRIGGEKATAKRKPVEGTAPPLPGQASAVQDGLGAVAEDELAEEEAEDFEDGVERGRLFVKVVGVKDLQLPLPPHEQTHFALTLDNGLHCVTTTWLDLATSAPIGQEFELVVLNDLEFQLTLQMKLEPPKAPRPASPTKTPASPKKTGALGRLFGSPKKKKESDLRASHDLNRPSAAPPSAYEMVQGVVAKDGSFARAYVSLGEHEKQAYGRPFQVDVKCFNEWAMEEVMVGSSRSKKGVTQLQRRPPYEIGKIELQLLYVPKPKGAKDEDMPKSMNSAVRAIKEAEERMRQQATIKEFSGHLSQQGGDCPYWRRRFFKLVGTKLTAYHEATRQPRATINLGKASKLINDKSALTQKETTTKGGGRRKSAFAEEEEGYMFVEEGFRIRFANGEVIDFYADSTAQKDQWMQALSQVVGKGGAHSSSAPVKGWTEMVLKREKSAATKARSDVAALKKTNNVATPSSQRVQTHGASGIPVPSPQRPSAHTRTESYQQAGATRSTHNSPVKGKVSAAERREKARSVLF